MEERWVVLPGDLVTKEHVRLGQGVYVRGGSVVSKILGLAEVRNGVARVTPFEGKYMPRARDTVIGTITDVKIPGYDVDINSPYSAFLPKDAVDGVVDYGDVVMGTIRYVDEVRNALLGKALALKGGELLQVPPPRVPNIIGEHASVLNLLRSRTGASIFVGANGRVWINGGRAELAKEAILMICKGANIDKITTFLEENLPEEERGEDAE